MIGYNAEHLKLNKICEFTPEGGIKWTVETKIQVAGSHDATIRLGRCSPTSAMIEASEKFNLECMPVCLYFSGNPTKFLQGHSVFGPGVADLGPVMQAAVRGLPVGIRPDDADSEKWAAVHRSRVDITTSVDMGSDKMVHEWIHTAATSTRSGHGESTKGRAMLAKSTVYWGQKSKRWTLKAYCKACELMVNGPGDLKLRDELKEYCKGHLRLELTLRRLELKDRGTLDESLIWDFFKRIEVGIMKVDVEKNERKTELPYSVRFSLSRWMMGEEVSNGMRDRTYYWHRRKILDELGVDISLKYEKNQAEAVVFDLDYLKAHEIKGVPKELQRLLFKTKKGPKWTANGLAVNER